MYQTLAVPFLGAELVEDVLSIRSVARSTYYVASTHKMGVRGMFPYVHKYRPAERGNMLPAARPKSLGRKR